MFLQYPFSAQSGAADANSQTITIPDNISISNASVQVVVSGFNTTDATITVQQSNDGTNWNDVTGGVISITSTSGSFNLILTNIAFKNYRLSFDNGTNSAGTFSTPMNFN